MRSEKNLLTRIVISARPNSILVELQLETSPQNFKTIDRYNTDDLSKPIKRNDEWIRNVVDCCSQPAVAALLDIKVPAIPALEEMQYQRLNRVENEMNAILMREQHNAEMRVEHLLKETYAASEGIQLKSKAAHA